MSNVDLLLLASPHNASAPTHLFYTDDVLLFCKGSTSNLKTIANAFSLYGTISRQMVNWDKSYIYFGYSIPSHRQAQILQIINMRCGKLTISYLGIPLFRDKHKKIYLRPIANKILTQLLLWKGCTLSMVGRVCLINSIVTSMFIYSFMVYK